MIKHLIRLSLGCVLAVGAAQSALAEDAMPPLLSISGVVMETTEDPGISLTIADLRALPETTIETSTIWTDGMHSFTGVALVDLMEELSVDDGTLIATAINDYAVEIPVSDAVEGGPIIAYLMDGNEMRVRDKGPLWVIYPYDSDAAYRTEVIYSRSIWQLDRLEIVE